MELIIKPTGRCNFNCTFCSANLLDIQHSEKVSDELKRIINILKPNCLIFTGGDPLLVGIDYYKEILSLGDYSISFTTNLKNFYYHPEVWTDLFKIKRVGVCTSFQYGNERRWDKDTVYDENKFRDVVNLFNERVGYVPSFISVISKNNEDRAIDHLYLAKELKTKCKINGVSNMGLSKEIYPMYKMIDIWLKIQELNLTDYWDNEIQFKNGGCNFNTSGYCESSIRTFWLDKQGNIKYGNCEDCSSRNVFIPLEEKQPCLKKTELQINDLVNEKCLYCPLCKLCNSCKVTKMTNKLTPNHCEEMKKREDKILGAGWKI